MTQKKPAKIDWQAIQQACQEGGQSVAEIAQAHGIAPSTIYRKRKTWQAEASVISSKTSDLSHLTMVKRLLNATDQQIRHLEKQHESGEAAFDEKEARMLGTIARTLDKIMDLTPQEPKQSDKEQGRKEADDGSEDQGNLDTLRTDLAKRLDQLQQGRASEISSGTDEN